MGDGDDFFRNRGSVQTDGADGLAPTEVLKNVSTDVRDTAISNRIASSDSFQQDASSLQVAPTSTDV